ncbi:hypothetical protein [Burkholderia sp. Nafp2/4-1b]|uniref:hypothetical protein n=1 Tax=Burkholderia sp. Nafp2/4-1b TaxID=2116686 RepID=UPI0013CE6CE3|nr:hypothetical protein [Burkholderia sp. Nafp2/4-1b]
MDKTNNDMAGFMRGSASSWSSGDPARRNRRAQSSHARECTSPLLPLKVWPESIYRNDAAKFAVAGGQVARARQRRSHIRHTISKSGQNSP